MIRSVLAIIRRRTYFVEPVREEVRNIQRGTAGCLLHLLATAKAVAKDYHLPSRSPHGWLQDMFFRRH
jgi:hypothetical protein